MNKDSDLDNDKNMHTDNEEEFCDNPPLIHPDLEGPHIEMLDQSVSVSMLYCLGGFIKE